MSHICYNKAKLNVDNNNLISFLVICYVFYPFIYFSNYLLFNLSLDLNKYLGLIIDENIELDNIEDNKEGSFGYISLSNQNLILEPSRTNELPKNLFYIKNANQNPLPNIIPTFNQPQNTIICLEKKINEILKEKEKSQLSSYKFKLFNTKLIISKILEQIIYISISLALIICLMAISFKNVVGLLLFTSVGFIIFTQGIFFIIEL